MSCRWSLLLALFIAIGFPMSSTRAATPKPILISSPISTRAIALDAVNSTPEPFTAKSTGYLYGLEQSTRIMLFALNLTLPPGDVSSFTADAEDGVHHHYDLKVEYAGNDLIYSTTNSFAATATGAGLFNFGPSTGLENRWDYFTVLDAP